MKKKTDSFAYHHGGRGKFNSQRNHNQKPRSDSISTNSKKTNHQRGDDDELKSVSCPEFSQLSLHDEEDADDFKPPNRKGNNTRYHNQRKKQSGKGGIDSDNDDGGSEEGGEELFGVSMNNNNSKHSFTPGTRNSNSTPSKSKQRFDKLRSSPSPEAILNVNLETPLQNKHKTLTNPRDTPPPTTVADHVKRAIGERWKGRLDYPNNSFYTGELLKREDGQTVRDGTGTSFDAVKSKLFEGTFVDDLKTGFGTTRYSDKVHQGNYYRGLRHGPGSFIFANGERYDGDFFRGEFHGNGKMIWKDGSLFEGTFKRGKIRYGTRKSPDKAETYEGYFDEKGLSNGYGVTSFVNGDFHQGFYRNGVPHGKGVRFSRSEGSYTYCEYTNGKQVLGPTFVVTSSGVNGYKFVGTHEEDDDTEKEEISTTGKLFGRLDGDEEDIEAEDRILTRLGHFHNLSEAFLFPPNIVYGTYRTLRSCVTAEFGYGPVVKEDTGACWHDLDTGNVRWARLGPSGQGPIGKALFVFATKPLRARLENYPQEGTIDDIVNL
jgi:hypothetical protein